MSWCEDEIKDIIEEKESSPSIKKQIQNEQSELNDIIIKKSFDWKLLLDLIELN